MARLSYVSVAPTQDADIANRSQARTVLTSGPINRELVSSQINTAVATRADKTYVDTADAVFATPAYYQGRDALNIPLSIKAQPNGIASLGSNAKIPTTQIPALGAGYLLGPYGLNEVAGGTVTTGTTPVKIGECHIGVKGLAFYPMTYASVLLKSSVRPVVEVGLASSEDATYAAQTVVARGTGRDIYVDEQAVAVNPCSGGGPFSPNMDVWLTLWVYSASTGTTEVVAAGIVSFVAFLMRVGG